MSYNRLDEEESQVILHKGTEPPYTGEYEDFSGVGTFVCRQCNTPLYRSEDKFHSGCGWPSFDDTCDEAVNRVPDADGRRTEIVCANCGGHLGHVFEGEGFTSKDTRHCVNSLSITFIPDDSKTFASAYFAGGCFWGVEYYFEDLKGVYSAVSGYMGGAKKNPTYKEVCSGTTGHLEVVQVHYNPQIVSYRDLAKLFFEIHDPTQENGQGPDIGDQYLSAVFVGSEEERAIIIELSELLLEKGVAVATKVLEQKVFYRAEVYHQNYYERKRSLPYCHKRVERF